MTTAHGRDAVADRLYALPPADFVPARDAEVAAARAAGDRARAAELTRLRRPTVAAWLVNLLALRRPDLLAEFLDLGRQLRAAQRDLQGTTLRELANQRRAVIRGLVAQACDLAVEAGVARSGLPTAEVEATLMAAMSGGSTAESVLAGRLLKSVHYAGFGETPRPQLHVVPDVPADPAASPESGISTGTRSIKPATAATRSRAPDTTDETTAGTGGTRTGAKAPVRVDPGDAKRRVDQARTVVEQATATVDVATTVVRECTEHLADLEARLMELRRDRVTAKTALSAAESALQEATLALRVSRQGVVMAERAADRAARRSGASTSADISSPDE